MKVSVERKHGRKRVLSTNTKSSKKKKTEKRSPSTSSCSSTSSSSSSSLSSSTITSSTISSSTISSSSLPSSSSINSTSSSDTSSSNSNSSTHRKHKEIARTNKKRETHSKVKKCKKKSKSSEKNKKTKNTSEDTSADVPIHLMDNPKTIAPMTKEQWEKQQSVVRKVYDETTGRHRLIKGDGEVIEEIVSREQHKKINAQATKGDAEYFQKKLSSNLSR